MRWYSAIIKEPFPGRIFRKGQAVYVRKEKDQVRMYWMGAAGGGDILTVAQAQLHLSLGRVVQDQRHVEGDFQFSFSR